METVEREYAGVVNKGEEGGREHGKGIQTNPQTTNFSLIKHHFTASFGSVNATAPLDRTFFATPSLAAPFDSI